MATESLKAKLARVFSIEPDYVDPNRPLHLHGVDDLFVGELCDWMNKDLMANVPVFKINVLMEY